MNPLRNAPISPVVTWFWLRETSDFTLCSAQRVNVQKVGHPCWPTLIERAPPFLLGASDPRSTSTRNTVVAGCPSDHQPLLICITVLMDTQRKEMTQHAI